MQLMGINFLVGFLFMSTHIFLSFPNFLSHSPVLLHDRDKAYKEGRSTCRSNFFRGNSGALKGGTGVSL